MSEIIASNFASASDAFIFFARRGHLKNSFNNHAFKDGIKTLLPNRFSEKELDELWGRLNGNRTTMNKMDFVNYFRATDFDGGLSLSGSKAVR